jgi:hypothetical protein
MEEIRSQHNPLVEGFNPEAVRASGLSVGGERSIRTGIPAVPPPWK